MVKIWFSPAGGRLSTTVLAFRLEFLRFIQKGQFLTIFVLGIGINPCPKYEWLFPMENLAYDQEWSLIFIHQLLLPNVGMPDYLDCLDFGAMLFLDGLDAGFVKSPPALLNLHPLPQILTCFI